MGSLTDGETEKEYYFRLLKSQFIEFIWFDSQSIQTFMIFVSIFFSIFRKYARSLDLDRDIKFESNSGINGTSLLFPMFRPFESIDLLTSRRSYLDAY